jgi:hypothetical protein
MMKFTVKSASLIAVHLWCIVGCGRGDSISGKVTYNNEPVQMGSVRFASADGSGPGFGAQVVNGEYKSDKVRLGKHIVLVRGLGKAPVLTKEESIKQREKHDNRYNLPVDYIPENADGNGRAVEIEGGRQSLDLSLKGPPRSG